MKFEEIDEFIVRKKVSNCSWCGSAHWGIHTIQSPDAGQAIPGVVGDAELRSLARMRVAETETGEIQGSVSLGVNAAVPAIVAECLGCGKMDFFNYYAVFRMIREEQKAKEQGQIEPNGGAKL